MSYEFTKDWFTNHAEQVWPEIFSQMPSPRSILEIGSYEGRSACWLLDNAMPDGGTLVCVDTWTGGDEHKAAGDDMAAVKQRFDRNIKIAHDATPAFVNLKVIQNTSFNAISKLACKNEDFDFIYIDGSHRAQDVLTDACMAFGLLKVGGVIAFDDYLWGTRENGPILDRPKIAIDMFANIFEPSLRIVFMGYQMIFQRTK